MIEEMNCKQVLDTIANGRITGIATQKQETKTRTHESWLMCNMTGIHETMIEEGICK